MFEQTPTNEGFSEEEKESRLQKAKEARIFKIRQKIQLLVMQAEGYFEPSDSQQHSIEKGKLWTAEGGYSDEFRQVFNEVVAENLHFEEDFIENQDLIISRIKVRLDALHAVHHSI